jgi:hypothetical protein
VTVTNNAAAADLWGRAETPLRPSDILLEAIVCFLAPLLLAGCSGDPDSARLAAIDTVAAYRARNRSELVKIAQIVAFGLMALDNLRLSSALGLPLSMVLRLRGGANALNRSAQQNARALEKERRDDFTATAHITDMATSAQPAQFPTFDDDDEITEADVQASIERARGLIADARLRIRNEEAAEAAASVAQQAVVASAATPQAVTSCRPSVVPPSAAVSPIAAQRRNLTGAAAVTAVAGECSGTVAEASGAQSLSDRLWAMALGSEAHSLAIAAGSAPPGEHIGVERSEKWWKSV